MASAAPSSVWIAEDDLLLKNAVEDGASLEALAKGAVQFSRRFTLQELQDRWHSLLYDADISAEASAHMVEIEISASSIPSKFNRADKEGGSTSVHKKRKIGSIRKQYYAILKRIRSGFFDSAVLGFAETNIHICGGNNGGFSEHGALDNEPSHGNCIRGDCISNHYGLQPLHASDIDILRQAFPQAMADVAVTAADANPGDVFHPNSVADNHVSRIAMDNPLHGFPGDVSAFSVKEPVGNEGNTSFEQNEDASHGAEHNSLDFGNCSVVEDMGSQTPPGPKLFKNDNLESKPSTSDSMNNNLENACPEIGESLFNSHSAEPNESFHTTGLSPPLPSMPLWKTMVDVSAPAMPVSVTLGDEKLGAEDVPVLPDHHDGKGTSSQDGVIHSSRDEVNCFITSTGIPEGEFADISDSLLDFSNDGGILFMDVDGKNKVDPLLLSSPKDVTGGDLPKVEPEIYVVSANVLVTADGACPPDSESHSVNDDQQKICDPIANKPSTSEVKSKTIGLSERVMYCSLNTEDPEIPCNDDIFLLIHPVASFASPGARPCNANGIETVTSPKEKDYSQGPNLMLKGEDPSQYLMSSMMSATNVLTEVSPRHTLFGSSLNSESPDKSCVTAVFRHATNVLADQNQSRVAHPAPNLATDRKLEKDVGKAEFGVTQTAILHSKISLPSDAAPIEMALPKSMVDPSSSDQEEPESDNDVPGFSDIEAMILEMDLGSYDQDSYFSRRVSRYQHEDSRRRIVRLEQCARSSLQRSMASQSALAILYGRHSKHFIRKTKVMLGRPTEEIDVDIDLGREGHANKISRRQAIIKMETDGSFILENHGKSLVTVNGRAVANGQLISLSSNCLIEIRGLSFVFEMNHKSIRRYLENLSRKSLRNGNNFEWFPEGEQ